jgi:uncharacterized protein YrzB (UPF0473 family)
MNYINVTNEDGKQEKLEIIDALKINQKEYVIVSPVDSDNAYAYKVIGEHNGEREYESIGNGKEFQMVLQKYNELHGNE